MFINAYTQTLVVLMSMTVFDAILLGVIQGATEFIPVSSTGHLVLAERFLSLTPDFTFSVLLNVGTLLALFIFFRRAILSVVREIVSGNLKYLGLLILATIPAGIVGFAFDGLIEELNHNIWVVAASLILIGILMVVAGSGRRAHIKSQDQIKTGDALRVGLSQVLALIPGVSRSGITILTSINSGFSKTAAAQFSFMMAIPIILAATLKTLLSSEGRGFISDTPHLFLAGNVASFLVGLLAVKFLVGLLNKSGLVGFGWYRLGLGAVLLILLSANII